jgi:antitoxin YefM
MDIVNASKARSNLFRLLEEVNKNHLPKIITSRKGDAVLVSREDWETLQETLYLQSIPNFVESIQEAEEADDWVSEEEFMRELDGMEN